MDEGVFVGKQEGHGDDSDDGQLTQAEGEEQRDQQEEHDPVEEAGDDERPADSEVAWNRVEAGLAVEIVVLAGVENVETSDPEGDRRSEQKDARVERAADGDPSGGRGNAQGESEDQVRPASEAFCVGIEKDNCEGYGREDEAEAVQLRSCQDKDGAGSHDEGGDERRSESSSRKRAGLGAGIGGIDGSVGNAVKGHRCGTGRDHGDDDPSKLMGGGQASGGEHCAAKGKRECENGVLPLDHLQRRAEIVEERHGLILAAAPVRIVYAMSRSDFWLQRYCACTTRPHNKSNRLRGTTI